MKIDRYAPRWWVNRVLRAERQLADGGVLAVCADDEVELPRQAMVELDAHPLVAVAHERPHGVAEQHLDVVADRAVQDANQVVAHDLDLAVPTHLVHRAKGHVICPPTVGPNRGQP